MYADQVLTTDLPIYREARRASRDELRQAKKVMDLLIGINPFRYLRASSQSLEVMLMDVLSEPFWYAKDRRDKDKLTLDIDLSITLRLSLAKTLSETLTEFIPDTLSPYTKGLLASFKD